MSKIVTICLTALVLISFFGACTDYRLSSPPPQRLRLKPVSTGAKPISYEYDAQNRQVAYSDASDDGSMVFTRGTIVYDAQGQYQQINETGSNGRSSRTLFTYQPDKQGGRLVTAKIVRNTPSVTGESTVQLITYTLDANNRLLRADFNLNAEPSRPALYTYTDGNITKKESFGNQTVKYNSFFKYDDKPNPFYGLISFPGQYDDIVRYNQNNIIEVSGGSVLTTSSTSYQYNEQRLPISDLRNKRTFTYEFY